MKEEKRVFYDDDSYCDARYHNGSMIGDYKKYYPNGSLKESGFYQWIDEGVRSGLDGFRKFYFMSDSTNLSSLKLRRLEFYLDGSAVIAESYYECGLLESKELDFGLVSLTRNLSEAFSQSEEFSQFFNPKLKSTEENNCVIGLYPSGNIFFEFFISETETKYIEYHDNGEIKETVLNYSKGLFAFEEIKLDNTQYIKTEGYYQGDDARLIRYGDYKSYIFNFIPEPDTKDLSNASRKETSNYNDPNRETNIYENENLIGIYRVVAGQKINDKHCQFCFEKIKIISTVCSSCGKDQLDESEIDQFLFYTNYKTILIIPILLNFLILIGWKGIAILIVMYAIALGIIHSFDYNLEKIIKQIADFFYLKKTPKRILQLSNGVLRRFAGISAYTLVGKSLIAGLFLFIYWVLFNENDPIYLLKLIKLGSNFLPKT